MSLVSTLDGVAIRLPPDRQERLLYWRRAQKEGWERCRLRFVRQNTDNRTTFIDIGAWIGPVSLFAAAHAEACHRHRARSGSGAGARRDRCAQQRTVEVWQAAIGVDNQPLNLIVHRALGDTMTSALGDPGAEKITVNSLTFEDLSAALSSDDVKVTLKVDIEGQEFQIAPDLVAFARRHGALSTSPFTRAFSAGRYADRSAPRGRAFSPSRRRPL